jgi:hypothetical protein
MVAGKGGWENDKTLGHRISSLVELGESAPFAASQGLLCWR